MEALNNTVNHVKQELLPDVDFDSFDQAREEKDTHEEPKTITPVGSDLKWD
jgi:hypothetical protein